MRRLPTDWHEITPHEEKTWRERRAPLGVLRGVRVDMVEELDRPILISQLRKAFIRTMGNLTPRRKNVLLYRYGFVDGEWHTLEETAEHWAITKERVRNIEAKALIDMRIPYKWHYLYQFFNEDIPSFKRECPARKAGLRCLHQSHF